MSCAKSQSLTMRDLVSLTGCRDFCPMLIRAFIDDSADETQSKVVVAAGFLGNYKQWSLLTKLWRRRLKRDGIAYFHAVECFNLNGEFLRFRDKVKYPAPAGKEAARALLADLEEIIREAGVLGVAVCIPMAVYKEIRETEPHANEIFPKDAFQIALQSIMRECYRAFKDDVRSTDGHQLAFVCDESEHSGTIAELFVDFKKINPETAEFLASLVHLDDKKYPQLQAADLMAHMTHRKYLEWLEHPNDEKKLTRLSKSVRFIREWNREYMLEALNHERKRRGLDSSSAVTASPSV